VSYPTKKFYYGERVLVRPKGRPPFYATVYSEYKQPGHMRCICVNQPDGCGIAYPVCYVWPLEETR